MVYSKRSYDHTMVWLLVGALTIFQVCSAHNDLKVIDNRYTTASLSVDVSKGRQISPVFFGIFFEEINHAGAGGLWAELVSNRGFEAGGRYVPSAISPWGKIGDDEAIYVVTELSSCFKNNPVAVRMDVLCDQNTCPPGGVGLYNPGYWGMNIEEGKSYKVEFHVKSSGSLDGVISFVSDDGTQVLAFQRVKADAEKVKDWTKMEFTLKARGSYKKARLQFTTSQKGTIWLDQISAMPIDTYKGHGFRNDLMEMLLKLKPRFLRFPGGCYVEGNFLTNAFRWKETVGPWEDRPGHLGDVWNYWSDDGLGYLEYLQLAEDLDVEPVWVVNNGIGLKDQVDTSLIAPFVQEMLDSVEFARGSPNSTWGSLRANDIVEMVSYAPLFVNQNDRTWNPDAIFFNTYKVFGIASYWVQTFFKESSGATLLNIHFHNHSKPENTYVSAISWSDKLDQKNYITVKIVNYNNVTEKLKISFDGIDPNSVKLWKKTVLTSENLQDDNTFDNPTKVTMKRLVPVADGNGQVNDNNVYV
uniref:non-reducing end alpha-L-arabinofuranosidase n=1 Tax=Chenopodium quinoa TaxID=63459 RepID=A0A803L8V2_CHEQI